MKFIEKGAEPSALREYNTTPGAVFDNCPKSVVRDALLQEQGFICAYCMQRISADLNASYKPKTEIEHFKSQRRYPDLQLRYGNMLGGCNGNVGKGKHKLICDKSKSRFDDRHDLTVEPQNQDRIKQIKYTRSGEIFSDIDTVNDDLNEVLNLNEQDLKEHRANLYKSLKAKIKNFWGIAKGNKTKVKALIFEEHKRWNSRTDNKFMPLCGMALYVLERELEKF